MKTWFHGLDVLLRHHRAPTAEPGLSLRFLLVSIVVLGAAYGLFMGAFAIRIGGIAGAPQLLASTFKLPALFLISGAITLPSLYVFSTIAGSRLMMGDVARLMLTTSAATLAIAASLGPILGFFTLSTSSYPFIVLLNIAFLGLAGCIGVTFLVRSVARAYRPLPGAASSESVVAVSTRAAANDFVLFIWLLVYAVVGTQTGWLLRPFIGAPDAPFQIWRESSGSFVEATVRTLLRFVEQGM
ncbi:MAG: hypothetical protein KDA21_15135 [Phycisphaerales bacterium]|nr:hypothetical protein [Phycisphaerales bacterium]